MAQIRAARIYLAPACICPFLFANLPHLFGLVGGKDSKLNVMLGQHLQHGRTHGGFAQPHAFGPAAKAMLKVFDAPDHLRLLVAHVGQGHDDVVVRLGNGRAVP